MSRSPIATLLKVIGGIVLLVPGICVIFVISAFGWPNANDGLLILLWVGCFAVSAIGIVLILKALG
jgi:hypothetical protein